jgi:archaellum component FlaC
MTKKTTDEKIDELARMVAKGFGDVKDEMNIRFDKIDERFEKVDENFREVNMKLHDIDDAVRKHSTRIERLEEASVV